MEHLISLAQRQAEVAPRLASGVVAIVLLVAAFFALSPSVADAYLAPGPAVPGVGAEPASVQTADLNGDGRTDLVIPNTGSDNVSILLGNAAGGFAPAVGSPVASDGSPGSPEPVAAVTASLNHDSFPDIAVVNKGTDDVSDHARQRNRAVQFPERLTRDDRSGTGRDRERRYRRGRRRRTWSSRTKGRTLSRFSKTTAPEDFLHRASSSARATHRR